MPRNRVEELEAKVTELESTVTGLTEELVEAKDRIRDLEAELEPDPADGSQFAGRKPASRSRSSPEAHDGGSAPGHAAEGRSGESHGESTCQTPEGGEGDKDEATHTEDEAADSGPGDDIIIA